MFGLPEKSTLAQRLGRANTKRRQILAYHQDHSDQISKYVDVVLEKAKLAQSNGPKTISTKWTQNTTASTILQNPQVGSDSGRTKFSVTTSTANDQPTAIPPPPKQRGNSAENEPFFCPYCHQTIQLENLEEDWRYHVLGDLRPYICTFGDCVKADQLYDSYTEWSEHERQFHRQNLACNLCPYTSRFTDEFRSHMQTLHVNVIPDTQLEAIIKVSWKPSTAAQQCPLCTKRPIENPRRFQQHLARHLQRLALFVLPRPDTEDAESQDGGSNESQRAMIMSSDEVSSSNLSALSFDERVPEYPDFDQNSSLILWWTCCACSQMTNPDLAPDRCSICGHKRCKHCSSIFETMKTKSISSEHREFGRESKGEVISARMAQNAGELLLTFPENEENDGDARHEGRQNLESLSADSPPASGHSVEAEEGASLLEKVNNIMNKDPDTKILSKLRSELHDLQKAVDNFYQIADKRKAIDEDQDAKMETGEAAQGSANKPPEQKPINFKDCIGRSFEFPFDSCSTWQVRAAVLLKF